MKIVSTTRRRFAIVLAAVIALSCGKAAPTTPSPPASPQPPAMPPSANVVVTISGPTSVPAGSPLRLIIGATAGTPFTLNVDYGDGSADTRSQPAAGVVTFETMHTYRNPGEYIVSATVTDDASGRAMISTKVVVVAR